MDLDTTTRCLSKDQYQTAHIITGTPVQLKQTEVTIRLESIIEHSTSSSSSAMYCCDPVQRMIYILFRFNI